MNRGGWTVLGAVAVHLALSVAHGAAHAAIPVPVPGWQYGYAAAVILLAPVLGVALLAGGRSRAGAWVVVLAGLGSLAFEGLFHFLIANPDHVAAVERGRATFAGTALLVLSAVPSSR